MLSTLLKLFIGVLLGFLSGLGIGGGSLLILWLTTVLSMDQATARAINLIFFIAAAGSVSLFRLQKGTLRKEIILPAVVIGCCAAGICSYFSTKIDEKVLQKCFGALLLFTGMKELFYQPRKDK